MPKEPFNIDSDNFELYFERQLEAITEAGKEALPIGYVGKLFYVDGKPNRTSIRKLNFFAKLWILYRSLNKRVWVVVENKETGMTIEEFVELGKAIRKRDFGQKMSNDLKTKATFITASRELGDYLDYINGLGNSPMYNYLMKYKNFKPTKTSEHIEKKNYIVRFLRHYEGRKKVWCEGGKINIPEWYILLYLYDKEYALGSEIYKTAFKRSMQSSEVRIKQSFVTLQNKHYIIKNGESKNARFKITPMGKDVVDYILNNYAVNC